jgi:4-alpha-glucanotransferase
MLYGVQTSYLNTSGQRCQAPPESLLSVLRLMGAPVASCADVPTACPAAVVLVNLEDLWLQTQPQNFAGTRDERPNWPAKARYPLEQITQMPEVSTALNRVRQYRLQRRAES